MAEYPMAYFQNHSYSRAGVLAIYIGLWVGYTKLGHQPSGEILHMSTWRHLYDLVFAN